MWAPGGGKEMREARGDVGRVSSNSFHQPGRLIAPGFFVFEVAMRRWPSGKAADRKSDVLRDMGGSTPSRRTSIFATPGFAAQVLAATRG